MAEEQVIKVLEEIRDLQRRHMENYRIALSNQQQALETQRQAVRRSRTLLLVVGAMVSALYLLPAGSWGMGWGLRCALRH
jgi:hypothetical protein